jgi:RNA polymerase sigma-70 factor (ECF subfamily)
MNQTSPADDAISAVDEQPASQESDEQLMLSFAAGQIDAFTALFARYKDPLFGFFRRRLADPALAEELTQETFIVILRSAPRYQPSALFRTFLYAIAFKILRAHRRKAAFRATFFGEQPVGHEPAGHSNTVVDLLMREAVARLDRIDREVLLLREFEKLSYAEIAEVLTLPINTVRSRLFRARTALHDLLGAPAPSRTSSAPAAEVRA